MRACIVRGTFVPKVMVKLFCLHLPLKMLCTYLSLYLHMYIQIGDMAGIH